MKRTLLTLLSIAAFAALPALAVERGFAQDVVWRYAASNNDQPVAEALFVLRVAEDHHASRMLLVTPEGRRIVLTHTLQATGVATVTLRDEQSGWSARTTWNYGAAKPTLQELFRAMDPEQLKPDAAIAMSLEVTGGGRFAATDIPYAAAPARVEEVFAERLTGDPAAETIRTTIPAEIQRDLPFLDAALTDEANGLGFRPVVDILGKIVDGHGDPPALESAVGSRVKGVRLTSPEQLAFASRFRSVQAADPVLDQ